VAIQGRRDRYLDTGMGQSDLIDEAGEVALHVEAEGEEVRQHDDAGGAGGGKTVGGDLEGGIAEFEEGGDDIGIAAPVREIGGDGAHGFVGRFDAGAVGENDDAGFHEAVDM
jgi:hypothetical protein